MPPQCKYHVAIQWAKDAGTTSTKTLSRDEFLDWFLKNATDRDIASFVVTPITGSV